MAYTTDDRAAALTTLESNGGNIRRTARETGIAPATLRRWRDETDPRKEAANDARMPAARAALSDRLEEFVHRALDVAPDKLDDANLSDLFRAIGISTDKLRLLKGESTEISEVRGSDARERLAARIQRLTQPPPDRPQEPN